MDNKSEQLHSSQFISQFSFLWIFGGGEPSGDQLLIHPDTDSNFTQNMEEMDLKEATVYRDSLSESPALQL